MHLESTAQKCLIFARGDKGNYFLDAEFQQLINKSYSCLAKALKKIAVFLHILSEYQL